MFNISPLGSSNNASLFGIFKRPAVIAQRKDGRQVELTREQIRELGQDPNQGDDRNTFEKARDFVEDLFIDILDRLKSN